MRTPSFAASSMAFVMITIACGLAGNAQTPAPAPAAPAADATHLEYRAAADKLIGLIGTGNIDDAIAMMTAHDKPELRDSLRQQLSEMYRRSGQYFSDEIVGQQRVSSRLQKATVLGYFEKQVIVFRMTFYRPQGRDDEKWMIVAFEFDTNLDAVFKDVPVQPVQDDRSASK
jgi:hypothetical protein